MGGAVNLRPYQADALAAAQEFLRGSISPCLIEAATGAGKSHIIAELAKWLRTISGGKRVLCLAPRAELVKQNLAKYLATGEAASMFSASAGAKSTRHPVVFGTPGTVTRAISRFCQQGANRFCAVIVDEAHGLTPTIRGIIDAMREANPNLRVVGLTATPYRLGSGYIFTMWPDGRANGDDVAREPYFSHCVYRVDARDLIRQGFLTPPVIGKINEAYDTGGLVLLPNGKFDAATVDAAFVGHGRKTAAIVADVVSQAAARKGVVFFAATVRHAEEIIASLPPGLSALITGETDNRERILKRFDNREIKYLVNVGVLTTGWDAPHVDLIAILRRTESVSLLQQIIGRGLRLYEGKVDCLVLDYADNLETHCPDGDLFAPVIKAGKASGGGEPIEAHCPDCGHVNEFTLNGEYADYQRDKHGYCLDVFGEQIKTEFGPLAAHYGRRCFGLVQSGPAGQHDRCGYRWTGKDCPACGEKNDIAARYCYVCRAEIVNPNDKLVAEFKALKRDPTRPQTDAVVSVKFTDGLSRAGAKTVRADWVTPYRQFSTWFMPQATHTKAMRDWAAFSEVTGGATVAPQTITYQKEESGFFRIMAYNRPADEEPLKDRAA